MDLVLVMQYQSTWYIRAAKINVVISRESQASERTSEARTKLKTAQELIFFRYIFGRFYIYFASFFVFSEHLAALCIKNRACGAIF